MVPLNSILDTVLQQLGVAPATYGMKKNEDAMYTCSVYYPHVDNLGNKYVSTSVGVSLSCFDDAQCGAAMGVIEHLFVIYQLEIIDYNFRNMVICRLNYEFYENQDVGVLKAAYNELYAQFESFAGRFDKVLNIVEKINSYVVTIYNLL
ncbi:conserved hypothetical protein [Ricinus communis]|uniref:Uncharacterized protein n=1 Tax=Ricinus communis TaxID=3988 RepID=B9RPG2_RICCO|nr:conserved hypothetical protein [Ricinus communis]